jgi:hypothetical protein
MLKEVLGPRMMQKLMQRRQAEEVSAAGKTYRVSFGHPTQGLPLPAPEGQSFLLQP